MAIRLVLALALLVLASSDRVTRKDVNNQRLTDLGKRLDSIRDRLKERENAGTSKLKELIELEGRIKGLEGSPCVKSDWQCASKVTQCVSDLAVCDGKKDCDDGSDEVGCDNPARAGTSFQGDTYNMKCMSTSGSPVTSIRVDVIGEKRLNWFPAVVETKVRLVVSREDGSEGEGIFNARYAYGPNNLVIFPQENKGTYLTLWFRTRSSEFANAEFTSVSSDKVCGEAILLRVD